MKVTLHITGQISGNFRLISAIQGGSNERQGMFNSFKVDFPSKAAAKKALFNAWKRMKADEPEFVRRSDWRPNFMVLKYDASRVDCITD